MAILRSINVLQCKKIEETAAFYQKAFQFVLIKKREKNDVLQWVHLMHGQTSIMLQAEEADEMQVPNSQNAIKIYFFVNNINELHHFIKINFKINPALKLTDYQIYEFSIQDPEGNTVIVGQQKIQNEQ